MDILTEAKKIIEECAAMENQMQHHPTTAQQMIDWANRQQHIPTEEERMMMFEHMKRILEGE
jgi:hypothetical protein